MYILVNYKGIKTFPQRFKSLYYDVCMPEVHVVGVACEPQRESGGQRMTPCSQSPPSSLLWIPG